MQEQFIWNNTIQGGFTRPKVDETGIGFIEEERDYFLGSKPGNAPYEYQHPLTGGGPFDSSPWLPG